MQRGELLMALGLVAGALLLVREALRLPIAWTSAGPGPGFFPFWLAVGVTIVAAVILVRAWRAGRRRDEPFVPPGAWKPLAIVFFPMVAVVALIHYLGIYLGGALYLAGYMRLVGRHRWAQVAVVSVALPLVLFLIFERWFLMPMPKGLALEWFLYGR
ncbi:MAG: tripartite tricarboxylate transporter TctB family protein [Armatimonadota bacterium]|nr:tripartite tricarboxylate transporter TctB family protein [Armatimonadota bacterium]